MYQPSILRPLSVDLSISTTDPLFRMLRAEVIELGAESFQIPPSTDFSDFSDLVFGMPFRFHHIQIWWRVCELFSPLFREFSLFHQHPRWCVPFCFICVCSFRLRMSWMPVVETVRVGVPAY